MTIILPASESDYQRIKLINNLYFDQNLRIDLPLEYQNNIGVIIVAKENDKVVGFLETIMGEEILGVNKIGVHPDYKRKGVGRKLMEEITHHALRENIELITLVAYNEAIPFYKSLGFEHIRGNIYEKKLMNYQFNK